MHKRNALRKAICLLLVCGTIFLGAAMGWAADAVNVILKNNSSAAIEVELIDQYGGNFTATIEAGTSQNQTLKVDSEMKVKDGATRKVTTKDEGKEVTIAGE
ncbi:MAG: hypothetical protein D3909_05920 [Candidatus Electrothrix sp. ATG1]|nr:hypothetical protein [Candidatus Electrothrix sp. ATG1]MCI5208826.1 hypothetical protein [Candidatus Electrothrix sp. ATG2]